MEEKGVNLSNIYDNETVGDKIHVTLENAGVDVFVTEGQRFTSDPIPFNGNLKEIKLSLVTDITITKDSIISDGVIVHIRRKEKQENE